MKKTYVNPEVYFESFELSANIAAGCEAISNSAQNMCAIFDKELGVSVFAEGVCDYHAPNSGDKPCYDVPQANYNVFTS